MSFYVRTQNKKQIIECKEIAYKYYDDATNSGYQITNENERILGVYDDEYKALFVIDLIQSFLNEQIYKEKCFIMPQNSENYDMKSRYPNAKMANITTSIDDNNKFVNRPEGLVRYERGEE